MEMITEFNVIIILFFRFQDAGFRMQDARYKIQDS
jgi:hypothetical protein